MGVVPSLWLSWSSARLLAMTLNSLCGLLQFFQSGPAQQDLASFDTLLALRLIQESLLSLDPIASSGGFDPDIFKAMRNLSAQLEQVAARGRAAAEKAEPLLFKKFESLLTVRSRPKLGEVKLLDEMLRWREKEQQSPSVEGQRPEEPWIIWRPENILQRCLSSRLDCCNCSLPIECEQRLASKGLVGFELDKQVLLALLLAEQSGKCPQKEVPEFLEEYFAERCANMWDDLNALTQKRRSGIRQLARMNVRTLGLLMEQVYLCGHIGFAQFANPHLLLTLLSWQNPEFGCWTAERADPVTEFGIKAAVEFHQLAAAKEKIQKRKEEEGSCLVHISLLAGLALSGVYLRFLLDPGPWPDQHGLSQLVQLDGVPSEDKFQAFPYLKWVRDSDIAAPGQGGGAVRLLRPPPSNWSPDLIAFVCLLFVIVLGVVLAIHFCGDDDRPGTARKGGPGRKKMYPYAFKRL